jgi:hypothetical protein
MSVLGCGRKRVSWAGNYKFSNQGAKSSIGVDKNNGQSALLFYFNGHSLPEIA